MRLLRSAILIALFALAASNRSQAELMLVSGAGSIPLSTNNYGFTGTYYDLYGPGGTQEHISHPGGGPVAFLYVFGADGGLSVYFDAKAGPYDGNDDQQVGVVNQSRGSISHIDLKSTSDIFGFDGDGISSSAYGAPGNSTDKTGYGGALGYFSNISSNQTSGTVNFIGGLAAGSQTFFSLENAPSIASMPTPVPEPSSLLMAGFGVALAAGFAGRFRKGAVASAPKMAA